MSCLTQECILVVEWLMQGVLFNLKDHIAFFI